MTRQSRKQKYTLTAKKYTLAAKKYTLTRNRCARCGARFMPPYLCRRNPTATMQAKRHIAAQTSFGKKIFRKMRHGVVAERIFPYLRPVCWRCSPSLWQLGKNRFIRVAASAAPHGWGGGSGKGGALSDLREARQGRPTEEHQHGAPQQHYID